MNCTTCSLSLSHTHTQITAWRFSTSLASRLHMWQSMPIMKELRSCKTCNVIEFNSSYVNYRHLAFLCDPDDTTRFSNCYHPQGAMSPAAPGYSLSSVRVRRTYICLHHLTSPSHHSQVQPRRSALPHMSCPTSQFYNCGRRSPRPPPQHILQDYCLRPLIYHPLDIHQPACSTRRHHHHSH